MHIISWCTILFILICRVQTNENDKNTDWKITFNPPEVTAVSGLCALISCTFIHPDNAQPQTDEENVCNNPTECKNTLEIQIKGKQLFEKEQIKLLEPDLTKNNCSGIIKEIKEDVTEIVFTIVGHGQTLQSSVKIIIQDEPMINIPLLSEGEKADLTCSAPFPCPETPPKITWWIRTRRGHSPDLKDNITLSTSKNLSTLTLTPTSDLHNATVGCNVCYGKKNITTSKTLEVTYVKSLQILGKSEVMEGDTLRLNCTVESRQPSSDPVWSFNGNTEIFMNQTSAGSVTITNVTTEHAGVYSCRRTFQNKTLNAPITINILNKAAFQMHVDIKMITAFLMGISTSAVIFSVVLCYQGSWKRDKTYELVATNTYTEVVLEDFQ